VSAAGAVLLLVAAASWATGSFASTRLPLPSDPLLATSLQMTAGGLVMLVAGLADGEPGHIGHLSVRSGVAFAYLVLIGSIVAYSAYVWLLGNAPLSQVATYAYVNPVVAVFLGWLVLGESVGTMTLLGAAVVIASVAAVVRRGSATRTADP
jgi:drug/metabolite transporter (DMT)-like permease